MYFKKVIGDRGEEIAIKYLENKYYKILERNYRTRFGEIDIIAKDETEIVFVEVKTRRNQKYGVPSEAVTKLKLKHMIKSAKYYLFKTEQENLNIRVDVIEIYLLNNNYKINHIEKIEL